MGCELQYKSPTRSFKSWNLAPFLMLLRTICCAISWIIEYPSLDSFIQNQFTLAQFSTAVFYHCSTNVYDILPYWSIVVVVLLGERKGKEVQNQ